MCEQWTLLSAFLDLGTRLAWTIMVVHHYSKHHYRTQWTFLLNTNFLICMHYLQYLPPHNLIVGAPVRQQVYANVYFFGEGLEFWDGIS